MVFSSPLFLFQFLPLLLITYFLIKEKYYNVTLLTFSLFFYAWGEPKNVLLMLLSILVNYMLARLIDKQLGKPVLWLVLSVMYNLGMLFVFKYFNFAVDIVNHFIPVPLKVPAIALPIGISFFTFQIMSYVIDVYRKQTPVQKNVLDLALYISLFPQLIAGPIVRYVDVAEQIRNRTCTVDRCYQGMLRFAVGFSKKVLIADRLAPLADTAFSGEYPSIYLKWIGMVAYALQIYFDFSGYSDMAIGLGKVFGFEFIENFNYPYISKSIQEFWRRWHISLSTWFRDYVYIPLGGSRRGTARTYINLMIVFFLTGLWHGASFNFIVWGLFYAVFLILERLGFKHILQRLPAFVQRLYTLAVVLIGWVFFRAETLGAAIEYMEGLFLPAGKDLATFVYVMDGQYWLCLALGIVFSTPLAKTKIFASNNKVVICAKDILVLLMFFFAVCYMVGSGFSPFLYFRF